MVVHPSGILGPYDRSGNHLVQLVSDYLQGKLPACVTGGYDFVDVRDVALGCLLAAEKGRKGECYILSNRHYEVRELLGILRSVAGGRRLPVLPMWMARAAAPGLQWLARLQKKRPLYTKYSLYTLRSNDKFSHDKATAELGYRPGIWHKPSGTPPPGSAAARRALPKETLIEILSEGPEHPGLLFLRRKDTIPVKGIKPCSEGHPVKAAPGRRVAHRRPLFPAALTGYLRLAKKD